MKVIFMGTPDFSVGALEAIVQAGNEVVLAVTQPDKPKGRGKAMQFPAVKEAALRLGIEVYQPRRVREAECIEYLRTFQPEIIIVAAFGQLLPKDILDMPKYGCVNIHASLLPKYRGAAPIQWSVINGEHVTGVTTMRMDVGLDTGDMIEQVEVELAADETSGSLFERLSVAGAKLCVETMKHIEAGTATYTKQKDEEATHTKMIHKKFGKIDWKLAAVEIERLIRGLNPWPSAYTQLDGKTLKIWQAVVMGGGDVSVAGSVVKASGKDLWIQTGEGILSLQEVQLEGKKRLAVADFLRGYKVLEGTYLVTEEDK
jgi:methionyl-tRNA formyltransferase